MLGKCQGLFLLQYEALSFPYKRETQSSVDFLSLPSRGPSLTRDQTALLGQPFSPRAELPQDLHVPSLPALRGSSKHYLPGRNAGGPEGWVYRGCIGVPTGQEPLYLGCLSGGKTHPFFGRDAHWLCGVRRRQQVHTVEWGWDGFAMWIY